MVRMALPTEEQAGIKIRETLRWWETSETLKLARKRSLRAVDI